MNEKTVIVLMIITIASKVIGFLREITLAYFYGASSISDAYMIALTIPSMIFSFVGVAVSTGYIPIYSQVVIDKGEQEANTYTSKLITIMLVSCTMAIGLGMVFTKPLVGLFAVGFEGELLNQTVLFTRITMWSIVFTGVIYILTPYLQINNKYMIPALIGFPMNIVTIITIMISGSTPVEWMVVGSVLAAAAQLIFLLPSVYKLGYRYKPCFKWKDRYLKKLMYLAIPSVIGISVGQLNILVDRTIASSIVEGGITALNYANKINGLVLGIFVVSVTTPMYPMLAKLKVEGNTDAFKKLVGGCINSINLIVVPACFGVIIFAEPIVDLMFGRGAFDTQALHLTTMGLRGYAVGLIGFSLGDILSRAFFASSDTKTPTVISSISVGLNIVLNIVLSRIWGIGGLAVATSISAMFTAVMLMLVFVKKIGSIGLVQITTTFVKIGVASSFMSLVALICYSKLSSIMIQEIALVVAIGIGVVVYGICIWIFKIEEVRQGVQDLSNKLLKKR